MTIMEIKPFKVLSGIVLLLLGAWLFLILLQCGSNHKIKEQESKIQQQEEEIKNMKADREHLIAKAQMAEGLANIYKEESAIAKKEAALHAERAAALEAKLKAMPKPAPPTNPKDIPIEPKPLIAAFQQEGFTPALIMDPQGLAFPMQQSASLFALMKDGKEYPILLNHVNLMGDIIDAKEEETKSKDLQIAKLEAENINEVKTIRFMHEARICTEKEIAAQEEVIKEKDIQKREIEKKFQEEKPKKWLTLSGGVIAGILITLL